MENQFFPLSVKEAKQAGISYPSTINRNAGFPTLLRELRKETDISQQKLAEKLGVTKSTIGLYENGDNVPDVKTLYKIAKFYNVSADYLLGLSTEKTTDTNTKAVCKYTGLSEEALKTIFELKEAKECGGVLYSDIITSLTPMDAKATMPAFANCLNVFDSLLSNRKFINILIGISKYLESSKRAKVLQQVQYEDIEINNDEIVQNITNGHILNAHCASLYLIRENEEIKPLELWRVQKDFVSLIEEIEENISTESVNWFSSTDLLSSTINMENYEEEG